MAFTGRLRELMKKYGKVALGVHFSVSAASITGMYVAIKNNVDVESLLSKVGISGVSKEEEEAAEKKIETSDKGFILEQGGGGGGGGGGGEEQTQIILTAADPPPLPQPVTTTTTKEEKNRTTELAASSGGALALAILCNKALFPVRVPITIALTPPIARFLARRKIIKNHV